DKVDYTAGIFWQYEYKSEHFLTSNPLVGAEAATFAALAIGQEGVDLGPLNTLLSSLVVPGGTVPLVGGIFPLATVHDFEIDGQTLAAFSQATWHITDDLELTVGGRYTQEQRESKLVTHNADLAAMTSIVAANDPRVIPAVPSMGVMAFVGLWAQDPIQIASDILYEEFPGEIHAPLGQAVYDSNDSTFSEFTPMASAAWKLPEAWLEDGLINSAMVYGTWSHGFKSGFQEPSGVDGLKVVDPERLDNREIGIKIDALEQSLRFNMALYSMTYEDMQLITVKLDSANSLIVTSQNAGESMIEGGELEIMWLPSVNTLVTFSYSNNNYKYTEFFDQDLAALALRGENVQVDRSDEDFAVSPSEMASLGIQHTITTKLGVFVPRVDVSYKGDIYMGLDDGSWTIAQQNRDLVYADAYALVDLRLSWENVEGDLSVAAYVKNAADKRYYIGAVATADTLGTFVTAMGDPRLFGVELRKTF
ncbi:MAG: TonB-dependent receptor domain-containing protein, partial [Spongiibacteraceae bacterium]